jgi:hypothetical protein
MIDCTRHLLYNLIMKRSLLLIAVLGMLLAAPIQVQSWSLSEAGLQLVAYVPGKPLSTAQPVDLNDDGIPEEIWLADGRAELRQGQKTLWASPESWQVQSASLGDLNRDGLQELTLLVWRPWQPWPVDRVLPYGGRIAGFQNAAGMSCHLILIGWRGQSLGERWAGSALADPLTTVAVADLDGDGQVELAALEGSYNDPPGSRASSLTVWTWNGFGFTLVDRQPGNFHNLSLINRDQAVYLVTTQ